MLFDFIIPFRNINFTLYLKLKAFDRRYSVLFDQNFEKWTKMIREQQKSNITLAEHITKSWNGANSDLRKLCESIESGEIKLVDLNQLQENYFGVDFDKLYDEINYLCDYFKIQFRETRMEQIRLLDKFRSSHRAAVEIENIRTELKLESRFDELTDLLRIETDDFRTWNLLKMDKKIEIVVNRLERVNHPKKIECLAAFAKCLDLVDWLRTNATDLSQLKTLVDMVSSESTIESMTNNSNFFLYSQRLLI